MKTNQNPAHSGHKHDENQPSKGRPHPLTAFFQCCLGDEPTPISPKIQKLRENLPESQTEEIHLEPGQTIQISKDMIIGDVIAHFPQTKILFEDIHPLGLLSPLLDQTTIEIFLSDINIDTDKICQDLSELIAKQ